MLDSKNALWLGSFFSLLLITFCVTRHLDDLNPNFMTSQIRSEKRTQVSDNTTQNKITPTPFVKDVTIIKVPQQQESNKGTQEVKVDTLHIEANVSTTQETPKNDFTLPNTFHMNQTNHKPQTKEVQKQETKKEKTHTGHKKDIAKPKKAKSTNKKAPIKLGKTLLESRFSKYEIAAIFHKRHESNKLNKIAFKYVIYPDTVIVVTAPNHNIAQQVKKIFMRRGIADKDFLFKQSSDKKAITIQLKERK